MNFNKASRFLAGLALVLGAAGAFAAATFVPGAQPTGWIARPTLTDTQVSSGNEVYFRGTYRMGIWSGDVKAHRVSATGVVLEADPWNSETAASWLDSQNYDTGRKIVTMNGVTKVPFRWASLATAQQAAINSNATTGQAILDYVRGDRGNEAPNGLNFRARASVLGDILHSTLYYWEHTGGVKRLYVGANDGMLHVFDAATGQEVFAYIPSMLIPNLNRLVVDPYIHTAFVDGPISMARVTPSSGTTRTLLVGGLGMGGKGLFALDVTDPAPTSEAAATSRILWEITATGDFANLGYTYGMPRIARLDNGTAVAIIGNGYLNSGNGHSVLFIINLETGARIAEIDTGSGSTTSPGGLSTPTLLDADGNGTADYAYAGDIDGKLWKFDLTHFTATLLYTTSPAQAITVGPVVRPHPAGGHLIAFATGRILTANDATDSAIHYVYGIWDGAPAANDTLLTQTLAETTYGSSRVRTTTANTPDWTSGVGHHHGWQVALPAGERVVGEAPFHNLNRYYFVSTNPTIAGVPAGENWLNEFDFMTGGSPSKPIYDLNLDGFFGNADLAVNGSIPVSKFLKPGVLSQPVLVFGSSLNTTVYNWHDNVLPSSGGIIDPEGPGVSAGHFDFDIYYGGARKKHVHEYDDKYDVTGVNMLNASLADFNLVNAISNASTRFKILVMNQYLNPAATLSVGGQPYENVKTYGNLTSQTDAATLLTDLPVHSRATIQTLIFNLPLDAFATKNWWGAGGDERAGLIPTQTGCVNGMTSTGALGDPAPNGERANGALTIQIIKDTTPASALELNHSGGDVRYGWRVKLAEYKNYVLAEYTTFWHHPNKMCYGAAGWVKNPPQDPDSSTSPVSRAPGSADPTDGIFSGGSSILSVVTTTQGNTTTTVTTYANGTTYTNIEEVLANGYKQITQIMPDGTRIVTTVGGDGSASLGAALGPPLSPFEEPASMAPAQREAWRELAQ